MLDPNAVKALKMFAEETSSRKLQVRTQQISSELSYASRTGCHNVRPLLLRRLLIKLRLRLLFR